MSIFICICNLHFLLVATVSSISIMIMGELLRVSDFWELENLIVRKQLWCGLICFSGERNLEQIQFWMWVSLPDSCLFCFHQTNFHITSAIFTRLFFFSFFSYILPFAFIFNGFWGELWVDNVHCANTKLWLDNATWSWGELWVDNATFTVMANIMHRLLWRCRDRARILRCWQGSHENFFFVFRLPQRREGHTSISKVASGRARV